jgi:dienelactone hydrolase
MKLNLKSQNQKLAATLIKPEAFKKPLPALIFIHGWKSNQEGNIKRATEIAKLGFICLTLDLRGHGKSEGSNEQFSRQDHLEDIKTAYNYLAGLKEVNPEKIGIIGSSYGGYLSAVASNFLDFKWLVLRVPALYFDQKFDVPTEKLIGKDETGEAFKSTNLTPKESLALKGVANFQGDILIVESEKDEIIPHQVIENYLKYIPEKSLTYEIMKDTRHSLESEEQEEEYIGILKNWLSKFL